MRQKTRISQHGGQMTADRPEKAPTEWLEAGFSPSDSQTFVNAGVPLAVAQQWMAAGIQPDEAVDFIAKAVSLDQAADLTRRGIEPHQVKRTDTGYKVELEPWQEDPLIHLPEVIEPGRFGLSLWSSTPWNDEHLETEVFFEWDGQHTVEWSVISGVGLSVMSEVSFRGTAGWPDRKDLLVVYSADDGGRGFERLIGVAPTAGNPNGAKDPHQWVDLATSLVGLTEQLLDSGIEPNDDFTDEYHRRADDEWFEFEEMFRLYLASAGTDGTLPDFDDWLRAGLEEGAFDIA